MSISLIRRTILHLPLVLLAFFGKAQSDCAGPLSDSAWVSYSKGDLAIARMMSIDALNCPDMSTTDSVQLSGALNVILSGHKPLPGQAQDMCYQHFLSSGNTLYRHGAILDAIERYILCFSCGGNGLHPAVVEALDSLSLTNPLHGFIMYQNLGIYFHSHGEYAEALAAYDIARAYNGGISTIKLIRLETETKNIGLQRIFDLSLSKAEKIWELAGPVQAREYYMRSLMLFLDYPGEITIPRVSPKNSVEFVRLEYTKSYNALLAASAEFRWNDAIIHGQNSLLLGSVDNRLFLLADSALKMTLSERNALQPFFEQTNLAEAAFNNGHYRQAIEHYTLAKTTSTLDTTYHLDNRIEYCSERLSEICFKEHFARANALIKEDKFREALQYLDSAKACDYLNTTKNLDDRVEYCSELVTWERFPELSDHVSINTAIQTQYGGFILVGSLLDNRRNNYGMIIWLDGQGQIKDTMTWQSSGRPTEFADAVSTSSGGILILGSYFGDTSEDLCLLMIDRSGNIDWEATFPVEGSETPVTIVPDPIGKTYVVLCRIVSEEAEENWKLLRFSQVGSFIGGRTIQTKGTFTDLLYGGCGRWIVSGSGGNESSKGLEGLVCFFDSSLVQRGGEIITLGDMGTDRFNCLEHYVSSDVIVGGYTSERNAAPSRAWVMRLDSNGEIVWKNTYGNDYSERVVDIAITSDNLILVLCQQFNTQSRRNSTRLYALNGYGHLIWQTDFDPDIENEPKKLVPLSLDRYLMIVMREPGEVSEYSHKLFLRKIDETGKIEK